MTHENPWFLITAHELVSIQKGLRSLEPEITAAGSPLLLEILGTLQTVQERRS